jgi:hypothetical protein
VVVYGFIRIRLLLLLIGVEDHEVSEICTMPKSMIKSVPLGAAVKTQEN